MKLFRLQNSVAFLMQVPHQGPHIPACSTTYRSVTYIAPTQATPEALDPAVATNVDNVGSVETAAPAHAELVAATEAPDPAPAAAVDNVGTVVAAWPAQAAPATPQHQSPPGTWYSVHPAATVAATPSLGEMEEF